jgi:uncharacterized membrane protein YidH (DUF202 family)
MTNHSTVPSAVPSTAPRQSRIVGLVIDEGVPAKIAATLSNELPARLCRQVSDDVDWQVQVVSDPIGLDESGRIPMVDLARRYRSANQWHIVVLITELPMRLGTVPLLADYNTDHCVALISLPALGAVRRRHRLCGLVVQLIEHLAQHHSGVAADDDLAARVGSFPVRGRHIPSPAPDSDQHLAMVGIAGRLRMLVGIVRANRPWRLVPSLQGATAAAAATAAFALFYSGIWPMAVTVHPWRLTLISVLAIIVMVAWFVCYNRLWDRPSSHQQRGEALLHNVSTVLTLAIGVTVMYVVLYLMTMLAALSVIDVGYLQSQLRHPTGLVDYARIVWLACSMGIMAGALGSSFDSEEAVRRAAFSRRDRQRQARHRPQKAN